MRKSSYIVLAALIVSLSLAPVDSTKDTPGQGFEEWRPELSGAQGCHVDGYENILVAGSILFDSSWITVEEGDSFQIELSVADFGGNLVDSADDLAIGFNIVDANNSDFMTQSLFETSHVIDGNGDSSNPFVTSLTAPSGPLAIGNYSLVAYAVSGQAFGSNYFHYVRGHVLVTVETSSGPKPPKVEVESDEIVNDKINFTIDISDENGTVMVELSVNDGSYLDITSAIVSDIYEYDASSLSPGTYSFRFNVTDLDGTASVEEIVIIPEPVTTTTTTTTSSATTNSTTPGDTDGDDAGPLGSITSVLLVSLLFIGVFVTPVLLSRRS
ncbi:MAG: hypothetical protein ACW98K_12405 [Candidatus Kariarchaeaceae archaeon]|jgi:hypothetical protein